MYDQKHEGKFLNDANKSSDVRNAAILLILAGSLQLYFSYSLFQLPIIFPDPFRMIMGTTMLVLGILSFCASLSVWLEKPWAESSIVVVGVTTCVFLIIIGYYLMIVVFAILYYAALDAIRTSRILERIDRYDD